MADRTEQEERGLAARHLVLVFLAGVAVCGVFFSLGFLVGYNERSSSAATTTEHVAAPPVVPPTVNPPLETTPAESTEAAKTASAAPSASSAAAPPAAPQTTSQAAPPAAAPAAPAGGEKPAPAATTAAAPSVSAPASKAVKAVEEAEGPAEPAPPPKPVSQIQKVDVGFTVQVAAARSKVDAEKLVEILKSRGYPVFLLAPGHSGSSDTLYRVQVGPFKTRGAADWVQKKLGQEGFSPFVKH